MNTEPVTDRRIAEMMCSATAECERGKPESACIVRASELWAMTRELSERRAGDRRLPSAAELRKVPIRVRRDVHR